MGIRNLFARKKKPIPEQQIRGILQQVAIADPLRLFRDGFQQYNPSILVTRKGLIVFDRMKRDDQVKAALAFRKKATLAPGWEVVSPEGKGPDWEIREFVEHTLNNLNIADLRIATIKESLKSILSAEDYGYSVNEKIYEKEGSKVVLKSLKSISPHYIVLKTDKYGNFNYLGQYQEGYSQEKELPIRKFVVHVNNMEFGNPYGTAELEAAYRPWLVKDNTYKWFAMFLEKKGITNLFALYDPNQYQGQALTDLRDVMTNLQAATVATIPRRDKDTFDLWEPTEGLAKDSSDIFNKALETFNQDIARAILLPSNIGMGGDTERGGSFARSKVHFNSFMLVVADERDHLAETVNSQIVKQLVDLNYTTDIYPEFVFLPDKDDSLVELMGRWAELLNSGAVVQDPEDEKHIRAVMGFPEVSEDRPEVEPEEPPDDDDDDDQENLSFTVQGMAVNVKVIDKGLAEIEAAALAPLVENLTTMRNKMLKKYGHGKLTASQVNAVDLKGMGMGKIQTVMREMLRAAHGFGISSVSKEIRMQAGIFTPSRALAFLNSKLFMISGFLRDDILKDAKLILSNAVKTGEVPGDTAKKLSSMFEKYIGTGDIAKKTDKGFEVGTPWHIETIIRTNVNEAFNNARLAKMKEHPDLIAGVEYSAIRDQRTTEQCILLDGRVFRLDDPALDKFTPPLHFNCRSLLVPIPIGTTIKENELVTPKLIGEVDELVPAGFGGAGSP